jgi:hypothetical protein
MEIQAAVSSLSCVCLFVTIRVKIMRSAQKVTIHRQQMVLRTRHAFPLTSSGFCAASAAPLCANNDMAK